VAPTAVVSGATATLKASQTDLITFTFNEAVNGFDRADISVSGGTHGERHRHPKITEPKRRGKRKKVSKRRRPAWNSSVCDVRT
jgi:Bacterial Ig-like domain